MKVAVVIPTFNAQQYLQQLFAKLATQKKIDFDVVIIDSSSTDETEAIARQYTDHVLVIPQHKFNHGATRELARKYLAADIVVMMTQDAIPATDDFLQRLVQPLLDYDDVAVTYARQLPRKGADIFEAFPRTYNYGEEAQIRSIEDTGKYGVYTFFCSNSCAAYKNKILDKTHGFKAVLTNEDYFAVADILQQGYRIAYVAQSCVIHSHRYTLVEEFKRYFDTGYVRAERPHIQMLVGKAEDRGIGFVGAIIKQLLNEQPWKIPYAIVQSAIKWLGFRVGFYGRTLPLCIKKQFSQQSYYWESEYYQNDQHRK